MILTIGHEIAVALELELVITGGRSGCRLDVGRKHRPLIGRETVKEAALAFVRMRHVEESVIDADFGRNSRLCIKPVDRRLRLDGHGAL